MATSGEEMTWTMYLYQEALDRSGNPILTSSAFHTALKSSAREMCRGGSARKLVVLSRWFNMRSASKSPHSKACMHSKVGCIPRKAFKDQDGPVLPQCPLCSSENSALMTFNIDLH